MLKAILNLLKQQQQQQQKLYHHYPYYYYDDIMIRVMVMIITMVESWQPRSATDAGNKLIIRMVSQARSWGSGFGWLVGLVWWGLD